MADQARASVGAPLTIRAKYDYKQAIRNAADDFEKLHDDEISEHLLDKESKQFWRAWTAKILPNLTHLSVLMARLMLRKLQLLLCFMLIFM